MSITLFRFARGAVAFRAVAAGLVMCPMMALAGTGDDPVAVVVDQAQGGKLPEKAATIVVGGAEKFATEYTASPAPSGDRCAR